MIILKLNLQEYSVTMWSGWGPVASSCEHGNEPSGSTQVTLLAEQLLFLKMNHAP